MELKSEPQTFREYLKSNKVLFDQTIMRFLPQTIKTKEIQLLYDMMRDYPSRGGKGLRGSLCLLWCELFSGKKNDALVTASALEIFQNWILIHDDIEDGSDMRRGLPALHKKFGVELAINTGDALHGKMWELLLTNRTIVGTEATLGVLFEFARMLNETTEGQHMDLSWSLQNDWNIDEPDYLLMVTKKAAWYTCITPCRLGLLISQNVEKEENLSKLMDQIVDFGTHLGIAFQIVDDVLNLTADETKYGKEILGDLYEGKRTVMLIHLLRKISGDQRKRVIESLSKPRPAKSAEEMNWIYDLMKNSGSIEYARRLAAKHSTSAMEIFDEIAAKQSDLHPRIYAQTRNLLEYLTSRDY